MENIKFEFSGYYLIKDNNIHRIKIGIKEDTIIFKCNNYKANYNFRDLMKLIDIQFNTIEEEYEYFITLFEENKVIIKEKIIFKTMKLLFKIDKEKEIEIDLIYKNGKNNSVINELKNNNNIHLKNEILNLKYNNNVLSNEINQLKACFKELNNQVEEISKNIKSNPSDIRLLKSLSNDSYGDILIDNSFCVFKSIYDIIYLIYGNKFGSIISYNLNNNEIIGEIKKAHNKMISNFRHFLDKINNKDLILTISSYENNLKLWDITNFNCLLDLKNINNSGYLYSACLFNYNNQNLIITSNFNYANPESIKVYDFKGKIVQELKNSYDSTYFIDIYYDKSTSINYIIAGNNYNVKSFDFNNNTPYKIYSDPLSNKNYKVHCSVVINDSNKSFIKLIECSYDGNLRIWNFHLGLLMYKLCISNSWLRGLCLWNENYLFVGCSDKSIKLIELKNGLVIKSIEGHLNELLTIKKIDHPKYGECLITQGWQNDQIKFWVTEI